ncbi:MAG: DUF2924 domain-containing protein, partial [Planctomycetes bacterium]|nr:DUF2924 domain-containing protein [Planctomycetota bacterium]
MTLATQIAELQNLSTAELAAKFERLHGRPPRYRSVPWLRKRIAYQLQVAALGGLRGPARAELDRLAAECLDLQREGDALLQPRHRPVAGLPAVQPFELGGQLGGR